MADELVPRDPALLALLAGAGTLPIPFGREITLLECQVAGTGYVDLDAVEPALAPGQRLALVREPDNPHDALAVRVQDGAGRKLGYLPRARNEVIARLLDAGKRLEARLDAKAWSDDDRGWLRLDVAVLLVEL